MSCNLTLFFTVFCELFACSGSVYINGKAWNILSILTCFQNVFVTTGTFRRKSMNEGKNMVKS